MTISHNRISVTLDAQTIAAIKDAFNTINNNLPFLIGLSVDEKKSMIRIDVSNKQFVEDAVTVVNNLPAIFPTYINAVEMQKDLTLYTQLDELLLISSQLTNKLSDTQILAGSEAYSTSLSVYDLTKSASKGGLPGAGNAYKLLATRFAKNGNFSKNNNNVKENKEKNE